MLVFHPTFDLAGVPKSVLEEEARKRTRQPGCLEWEGPCALTLTDGPRREGGERGVWSAGNKARASGENAHGKTAQAFRVHEAAALSMKKRLKNRGVPLSSAGNGNALSAFRLRPFENVLDFHAQLVRDPREGGKAAVGDALILTRLEQGLAGYAGQVSQLLRADLAGVHEFVDIAFEHGFLAAEKVTLETIKRDVAIRKKKKAICSMLRGILQLGATKAKYFSMPLRRKVEIRENEYPTGENTGRRHEEAKNEKKREYHLSSPPLP